MRNILLYFVIIWSVHSNSATFIENCTTQYLIRSQNNPVFAHLVPAKFIVVKRNQN